MRHAARLSGDQHGAEAVRGFDRVADPIPEERPASPTPVTVIRSSQRPGLRDLGELWAYRELLYFLVWRDLKVRYRQTVLGVLWAIIQPLATTLVFSIFFGRLARMPSDGVPYPLFALAALVPWTFFAQALSQASNSVISSQELIRRIYFPRLAIPLAAVLPGLVDFVVAFLVLLGAMAIYGFLPGLAVLWLLPLVLLTAATALGVGLWLAAINVRYRDVRHIVPFLIQTWLFLTPIAYPSTLLGEPWRTVYGLNPMAGVVEGFRWALLGTGTAPGPMIAVSALATLLLLTGGVAYFRRTERTFADVI